MANSVDVTIEEVLTYLEDNLAQEVIEQAFIDADTVLRDNQGRVKPFVAVSFGDLQQGRLKSMASVTGDDHTLPLRIQAVGPTPKVTRQLWSRTLELLLGKQFTWTGETRKRPGGALFPIANTDNSTEAFSFAASFGIPIQFQTGLQ